MKSGCARKILSPCADARYFWRLKGRWVPQIARNLGCGQQTARDAIHDFNERSLDVLEPGSSRPKRIQAAFDEKSAEAVREIVHRSPREFGSDSSLWTLEMAAQVSFEEGLTESRVSGRPSGLLWSDFSGCVGSEPSGGSPLQIPCTKEKKAARPTYEHGGVQP